MLRIERVSKSFVRRRRFGLRADTVEAVREVSLEIPEGEIFGLIGRSGSGKTTLGMVICGILEPTGGRVTLEGKRKIPRFQMIFQDPREALNPRMRVLELIVEPLSIAAVSRTERRVRVESVMEKVNLEPGLLSRYSHELSGGQRQRVAIARSLVAKPDVIVADEPTSMLDTTVSLEILDLLATLNASERITFLFITHDLGEAGYLCHRLGIMSEGRIVEVGAPESVFSKPSHPETGRLIAAAREREAVLRRL